MSNTVKLLCSKSQWDLKELKMNLKYLKLKRIENKKILKIESISLYEKNIKHPPKKPIWQKKLKMTPKNHKIGKLEKKKAYKQKVISLNE